MYSRLVTSNIIMTKTQWLNVYCSLSVVIKLLSPTLYPIHQWKKPTIKPRLVGCVDGRSLSVMSVALVQVQAPKDTWGSKWYPRQWRLSGKVVGIGSSTLLGGPKLLVAQLAWRGVAITAGILHISCVLVEYACWSTACFCCWFSTRTQGCHATTDPLGLIVLWCFSASVLVCVWGG